MELPQRRGQSVKFVEVKEGHLVVYSSRVPDPRQCPHPLAESPEKPTLPKIPLDSAELKPAPHDLNQQTDSEVKQAQDLNHIPSNPPELKLTLPPINQQTDLSEQCPKVHQNPVNPPGQRPTQLSLNQHADSPELKPAQRQMSQHPAPELRLALHHLNLQADPGGRPWTFCLTRQNADSTPLVTITVSSTK